MKQIMARGNPVQFYSKKAKPLQVFMSHKSCDKAFAMQLATDLRRNGIKTWHDDWSMPPGKPLTDAMERGIQESDVMLLILTAASVDAIRGGVGGLAFEVHIGEDRCFTDSHFRIIGIQREKCDPPPKLRNRIGRWLDFIEDESYPERLSELLFWITHSDGDRGPEVHFNDAPQVGDLPLLALATPAIDTAVVAFAILWISKTCNNLLHMISLGHLKLSINEFFLIDDLIGNLLSDFSHSTDNSHEEALNRFSDFLNKSVATTWGELIVEDFIRELENILSHFLEGFDVDQLEKTHGGAQDILGSA